MTQLFSNNAGTTLASALTDVGTSMVVVTGDGALFEAPTGGDYELITLTDGTNIEIVKATARSTDTLTIARAQEGTTAQAWAAGTVVEARLTAATLDQFPRGFDNGGNVKGADAVSLQTARSSATYVASGDASIAIGFDNMASGYGAIAIGYNCEAVAVDAMAIGGWSYAAGANGVSIGRNSESLAAMSIAIGYAATVRVEGAYVITGMSLIRKDNSESATDEHLYFTGSQAIIFSKEINLTAAAADDVSTITVPTGATFFPDEIGLVITAADTVTGQPSVSFGISGNTVALLASTATTKTATKGRDIFTLLSKDGVNSLTVSVKTAATATTLKGRFYWKGVLVEDE